MVEQIFLSPEVQQNVIISNKLVYQARSWGGRNGCERTRPEKIVPFIFLPKKIKVWKKTKYI